MFFGILSVLLHWLPLLMLILFGKYLGGWKIPQRKSYFTLKLPKGWWVFGVDLALQDDIDMLQFTYFLKMAKKMKDNERTCDIFEKQAF